MKKLCLILTAVLLMSSLSGLAQDLSLDQKLTKQVQNGSGLRLSLEIEPGGQPLSALDSQALAILSALLPGGQISLSYQKGAGVRIGQEDVQLSFTKGGQTLLDARLLRDLNLEQLSSSLLGDLRLVDLRGGSGLVQMFSATFSPWPSMGGLVLKLANAEASWQAAASKKMDQYVVRLTVFLQAFSTTQSLRDENGQLQTQIRLSVPVDQLKAQIKLLLSEMYRDGELLTLLSQQLSAREQAAYLQPAMADGFFSALDALPLTGSLSSIRLVDHLGQLVQHQLSLPMGGVYGLSQLDYAFAATDSGDEHALTLLHLPDAQGKLKTTSLSLSGGKLPGSEEISFAGRLASKTIHQDLQESQQETALNLLYAPGKDVVSADGDSSSKDIALTLMLIPKGEGAGSGLSIQGNFTLTSRLRTQSATFIDGSLILKDLEGQGQMLTKLSGNTTSPWVIPPVDLASSIRLDQMSQQELQAQAKAVQQTLLTALLGLLGQAGIQLELPEPLP